MRDPRLAAGRARAKWALLDDLDQSDDLVVRDPVGELRMVAAEMLQREVDDLSLSLAADDLAALACDLPGHGWVSRRLSGSTLSRMLAQRLERRWTTPMCSSAGASWSSSTAAASSSASPAGRV